jgi:hypothetical protein
MDAPQEVQLVCLDGRIILVRKAILVRNSVFAAMLASNMREALTHVVEVHATKGAASMLVQFIDNGVVLDACVEYVREVAALAHMYEEPHLASICFARLRSRAPGSEADFLNLASLYADAIPEARLLRLECLRGLSDRLSLRELVEAVACAGVHPRDSAAQDVANVLLAALRDRPVEGDTAAEMVALVEPHLRESEAARDVHCRGVAVLAASRPATLGVMAVRAVLEADYLPRSPFPRLEVDVARFACAQGVDPTLLTRSIRWACVSAEEGDALLRDFPQYAPRPPPHAHAPYPRPCRRFARAHTEPPDGGKTDLVWDRSCANDQHCAMHAVERIVECAEDGVPTPGVGPYGFVQAMLNVAGVRFADLGALGDRVRACWPDMELF